MRQKLIIQKLWMFIAMLCASLSASAYDFEANGLYYKILSEEERTVEVTYYSIQEGIYINYVSGDIDIPRRLVHNSKTYSVTSIGYNAFRSCSSLTSVTIPNSVISIKSYAFHNCSNLTKINVDPENTYYSSNEGVLYNKDATRLLRCPQKKSSVTIPNSVTFIGGAAFEGCSSLTSVTIPNSVTSIGGSAFYSCGSLTSVTIPNSVTSIGDYAFYSCGSLTSVTIPSSVTSIGRYAFGSCGSLTSVTIPSSVTSIGGYAFGSCGSLTSVTIPNSVTSIGDNTFLNCPLRTIYMQRVFPLRCSPRFRDDVLQYAVLYVPTGTKAAYEKVDPWRDFWNIEEMEYGGIDEIETDTTGTFHVTTNGGTLTIHGLSNHEDITVYDMQGRIAYNGTSHTIDNLSPGFYVVKAENKSIKVSI